jgi:hypothetical protein
MRVGQDYTSRLLIAVWLFSNLLSNQERCRLTVKLSSIVHVSGERVRTDEYEKMPLLVDRWYVSDGMDQILFANCIVTTPILP